MNKIKIYPCIFCKGQRHEAIFLSKDYITNDQFWLYRCSKCSIVETQPKPKKNIMISRYYRNYRKNDRGRFINPVELWIDFCYSIRVKLILQLINKKGSILDVGCGRGLELQMLKQKGWQVLGTEIFNDSPTRLSNKNIPIIKSDIWKIEGTDKCDVITFWHSLEHLYYPNKALEASFRLLKSGGYLIVAIPNFESFESRIFKKNWFHIDVPRHLFHFSKTTLVNFVEKLGYKLHDYKNFSLEYDFYSFLQSGLNALFPSSSNILFRFFLGEKLSFSHNIILLLQLPIAIILFLFGIVFVPIFTFLFEGGTMVLIFKK